MGEYEPEDSRTVTQSTHTAPGEPARTGPREDAARRQSQQEEGGKRQPGYGNARDEQGQQEQDVPTDTGDPFATPTLAPSGSSSADDPAALRRDAARPLGKR